MITDTKSHKVVVKGEKADPLKVVERVQTKSHRKVELLSPIPKPPSEEDKKPKEEEKPKPEEKKEEVFVTFLVFWIITLNLCMVFPLLDFLIDCKLIFAQPQTVTVVLKVHMHCEACSQEIKRRILRMKGLY